MKVSVLFFVAARRDVRKSGGHFFSRGKETPPQTPKEKSLVQLCSQIPFSVVGLLPEARGKSAGASVRHVIPLAPLAADVFLIQAGSALSLPLGGRWQPEGLTDEGDCGHGRGPAKR